MKREPEHNLVMPGLQVHGWTILSYAPSNRHGAKMVRCRCSCGCEKDVVAYDIRRGASRDCGHTKMAAFANDRHKHGDAPRDAKSQDYKTWLGLKRRYPEQLCAQWAESFTCMMADLPPRPSPAHRIHVIDKDAPILRWNVEWRIKRGSTIPKNVARAARRVAEAEARQTSTAITPT